MTDEQFDRIISAIERLIAAVEEQTRRMPPQPPEMFQDADGRIWHKGGGGGGGGHPRRLGELTR